MKDKKYNSFLPKLLCLYEREVSLRRVELGTPWRSPAADFFRDTSWTKPKRRSSSLTADWSGQELGAEEGGCPEIVRYKNIFQNILNHVNYAQDLLLLLSSDLYSTMVETVNF